MQKSHNCSELSHRKDQFCERNAIQNCSESSHWREYFLERQTLHKPTPDPWSENLFPPRIHSPSYLSLPLCIYPAEISRRLQVINLTTPENVKRHTTGQQRPIFNCSLQLQLTVDSGTPRHPARSSTVHCQSELLGTVENTIFAGRWCGVCPTLHKTAVNPQIDGSILCIDTLYTKLLQIFHQRFYSHMRGQSAPRHPDLPRESHFRPASREIF